MDPEVRAGCHERTAIDIEFPMTEYANTSQVRAAREQYFAANGFSDATYRDAWVHVKIGRIPLMFPNTRSRQRAIPLHDLHHVATGYATTLVGEGEIGAFEVAGGCGRYWAAWFLNASAMTWGLALSPRRIYRAFIRGRHSRTLYQTGWSDELLELTVGELRRRVEIDREPKATWGDRAAFAGWVGILVTPGVVVGALIAGFLR
ncbi:MAG: hypothetical protein JWO36_1478 [Myxococcales bacterium]|nr:hypothetical protein [Myxococcales bacterium]